MIDYSRLIADLKLVKQLKKSTGRDDIPATEIEKLVAMVNDVADIAGPLLERIPQTFKQYTDHNIGHCRNLIDLMGRFIPRKTLGHLNGLEMTVLLLSALLHDFGMFVTEQEKSEALKSTAYESFLTSHHDRATAITVARSRGDHRRADVIEDALLAEFFRRMHPERARINVQKNLGGKLLFRDEDISPYVLDVCESHAWGVHESNDLRYPDKAVSRLSTNRAVYGVPLNLQYIACCLRLADIMDFDRSRTPLVVFQNIDFTEDKSWAEWNKHLQVKGWKINEHDVMFRTECKHPSFYVAVMEFLDWVDVELSECRRLVVKEAPKEIAEHYMLHLPPVVDRSEVEMEDKRYLAGAFRFQLEYERIMKLLMDKSLYPDPSLFLRELLQNSLDACRNREAHSKEFAAESFYTPRIAVWDYSNDPAQPRIVFQDNGMGMSRKIVEEYFMRVGRSYYRSPEFDAERQRLKAKGIELEATSQFGIGILSCFMVADRFEVETYRVGHRPLHITIEGPTKYFIIKLQDEPPRTDFPVKPASDQSDGPPHHPGTRVTVHLRPDTQLDVYQTLNTFAANVDYDITIYRPLANETQTIQRRRWDCEENYADTLAGALDTDNYSRWGRQFSWAKRESLYKEEIAENLKEVLAISRVPFEKYDFSSHLCGGAWFWLLKAENGGVCPQSGYLQISRTSFGLRTAAYWVRQVLENSMVDFASDEWNWFLATLPGIAEGTSQKEKSAFVEGLAGTFEPSGAVLLKQWNSFSTKDRLTAYEALKSLNEEVEIWYESRGILRSLLAGNDEWAKRSVRFSTLGIRTQPQSVALYGVSLPAGFVEWNPMEGYAERLDILNLLSGVLVDIRGANVPTPAANRLFILSDEAKKVLIPFNRACLYHALDLSSSEGGYQLWRDWLNGFMDTVDMTQFWPEIIINELELLEEQMKYAVRIKGEDGYLTKSQVVDIFGRWAPVLSKEIGEGIDGIDTATLTLLCFKSRRERKDGVWEIDMESKVPVQEESLYDTIERLRGVAYYYRQD